MAGLREALAETRALLRKLLEEQTLAERELNEQRIAVGLPPKPFVSVELRDAVAKLDHAENRERTHTTAASEEVGGETAAGRKQTSGPDSETGKEQRRMSHGQDD